MLLGKTKIHNELAEGICGVFCTGSLPRPNAPPLVGCSPTLWLSHNSAALSPTPAVPELLLHPYYHGKERHDLSIVQNVTHSSACAA
jgi:hypothetical protein